MNRQSFERMLAQRTTRRLAAGRGFAAGAAGLIGVSFGRTPTRTYARQASPEASPVATEPSL